MMPKILAAVLSVLAFAFWSIPAAPSNGRPYRDPPLEMDQSLTLWPFR
jgi:hypothetical protein